MARRTRRASALHVRRAIGRALSSISTMLAHPPLHWWDLVHIAKKVRRVLPLLRLLISLLRALAEILDIFGSNNVCTQGNG